MLSPAARRHMGPHHTLAVVALVENSSDMGMIWSDLLTNVLGPLCDFFEQVNGAASAGTTLSSLVIPSLATINQEAKLVDPSPSASLRDQLRDFEFNCEQGNRITTERVRHAVEFLCSSKFEGDLISRHLIIVSASTPVLATYPSAFSGYSHVSGEPIWHTLASLLSETESHCHLVLSQAPELNPLNIMFDEMLRLKGREDVESWFPVPRDRFIVRMSTEATHLAIFPHPAPYSYPQDQQITTSPFRRHNSHPSDLASMRDYEPPATEHTPSLVAQLQQAHGLSKKRIYGTKPAPEPLFRNERVRERSTTLPTIFTPPRSGFSERLVRSSQNSPTDVQPRMRGRWQTRRGSRVSSPEADALNSPSSLSPLSEVTPSEGYFSSAMSSPITPATPLAPSIMPSHKVQGMQSPLVPPPIVQPPLPSREEFAASILNGLHGVSTNASSLSTPLAPITVSCSRPALPPMITPILAPPPASVHEPVQVPPPPPPPSSSKSRKRRASIEPAEEFFNFDVAERAVVEVDKILADNTEHSYPHMQPPARRSELSLPLSSESSATTHSSFITSPSQMYAAPAPVSNWTFPDPATTNVYMFRETEYTFASSDLPVTHTGYSYGDYRAPYLSQISYSPGSAVVSTESSLSGWCG